MKKLKSKRTKRKAEKTLLHFYPQSLKIQIPPSTPVIGGLALARPRAELTLKHPASSTSPVKHHHSSPFLSTIGLGEISSRDDLPVSGGIDIWFNSAMGASTTWFNGGELEVGEIEGGELEVGEIEAGELEVGEIEAGELEVGEIEAGEFEVGEIEGGELKVGEIEDRELKVGVIEGGELKVGVNEGGELKVGVIEGGYANLTGSIPARPCTVKSGPSKIRGAMITTPFAVTMPDPLIKDKETGWSGSREGNESGNGGVRDWSRPIATWRRKELTYKSARVEISSVKRDGSVGAKRVKDTLLFERRSV
jgi:hypothetical protein